MSSHKHKFRTAAGLSLLCLAFAVPLSLSLPSARADVRRTGQWPSEESERISLNFEGSRSKALRALATAAGWSIIDNPGSAVFTGAGDAVNVFVTDQPAAKVLELMLSDGDYIVKRDGKLLSISIQPGGSKRQNANADVAKDANLPPPPPPFPGGNPRLASQDADDHADESDQPRKRHAEDRTVLGSKAVVGKDEVVGNLTVLGGSTELFGTVQEDVLVMGGSIKVRGGSHVYGDVSVLGGSVNLEDGSRVDGDLSTAGGHIERATGAIVKGEETSLASGGSGRNDNVKHKHKAKQARDGQADDADDHDDESNADKPWSFASVTNKLGSALSRAALLYAFGCVLLAIGGAPMQRMQQELAERPMRAFGLGVATFVAGIFALIALCVTIIGIPVAILLLLVGALGVYAGMCAVFIELGALVLEERTPSPYVHLALGCLIYLIFSTLPVIGWVATAVAVLCGLGLLVSTRMAGLLDRSQLTSSAPA
jgi:hypothetical protein